MATLLKRYQRNRYQSFAQPISARRLKHQAALRAVDSKLWIKRMAKHMTQEELAARVGVARKTISQIESGKNLPSLYVALRIADALYFPVDEIFKLKKY